MIQSALNNPTTMMKNKSVSKPRQGAGRQWQKALDVAAYDKMLAQAYHYVRAEVRQISLMEAERRSKLSHQFWSKVEKAVTHPSTHTEVLMGNALRVRPSVMHRLAERWLRMGRKLKLLLLGLLPLEPEVVSMTAGA